MILQTKRLILRAFTKDDLSAVAPLLADPEVMRFSIKGPLSYDEAKEYLEKKILPHYEKHGFGLWAVISKEGHSLIGLMGLIIQLVDGEELMELDYRLATQHWGKGLATEAAEAIRDYAFNKLKVDQIISLIEPKNFRSIKVAKRVGMHLWKETILHGLYVYVYRFNPTLQQEILVGDGQTFDGVKSGQSSPQV